MSQLTLILHNHVSLDTGTLYIHVYIIIIIIVTTWLADLAGHAQVHYCAANVTFELSMSRLKFAHSVGASVGPKPTYADTICINRQTDRGHIELARRLASLTIIPASPSFRKREFSQSPCVASSQCSLSTTGTTLTSPLTTITLSRKEGSSPCTVGDRVSTYVGA